MVEYDYYCIIGNNVNSRDKVDVYLCRSVVHSFFGKFKCRDEQKDILSVKYEVIKDKDSIQSVVDDMQLNVLQYEEIFNKKREKEKQDREMAIQQRMLEEEKIHSINRFIGSINGASIKKE